MQIMEIASRLQVWHFIKCDAYLAEIELPKDLKHELLNENHITLQKHLSRLAYKLNISESTLKDVYNGNTKPMSDLIKDASLIVITRKDLADFIGILMRIQNINGNMLYKAIHMTGAQFKNLIKHGKLIANITIERLSGLLSVSPAMLYRAFSQVGFHRITGIVKHTDKNTQHRDNLKGYLKALCYLQGLNLTTLSAQMGYKSGQLFEDILNAPEDKVVNDLQQVPFILHTSMKTLKGILRGNTKSRDRVLQKVSLKIKDRKGLQKYVHVLTYLYNTNVKALSESLGHSGNYVNAVLQDGTGEALSAMFSQIAKKLNADNNMFTVALARANVSSAYHTYSARMYFIIHYLHNPINYYESERMHQRDRDYIAEGFRGVQESIKTNNSNGLEQSLWSILLGWGHMFGYSAKDFIRDNFKQFTEHKHTYIKQGNRYHAIMNNHDWPEILQKLHEQLKKIKYAFNLTDVQKGTYAPYVYIKGVHLSHPVANGAQTGLSHLGKGRILFHARFNVTDIKQVNNSPYDNKKIFSPVLKFKKITHDGKLVADHVTFNYTKGFQKLGAMMEGDLVSFTARVKPYYKGEITKKTVKTIDYTLNYPGQIKMIRRIHQRDKVSVPSDKEALVGYAIEHNHSAYDFSLKNYQYIRYCKIHYHKWLKSSKK